jgi:secreted trypsin-like serine protease
MVVTNHGRGRRAVVRPFLVVALAALALACGEVEHDLAPSRDAITYGEADFGSHPNVGSLMLLFEDGVYRSACSGVLIAPTVFLTAGHCVAWFWDWAPKGTYGVSFLDDVRPSAAPGLVPAFGQAILHPGYDANPGGSALVNDFAVILLDEPAAPAPAQLPALGALDALSEGNGLHGQTFTAVGYGVTEELVRAGIRRFSTSEFRALVPAWLHLSQNPSTGDGGTCDGDSGAPHFLGDGPVVVSITSWGDPRCRSLDATARLDTPAALEFLAPYLP